MKHIFILNPAAGKNTKALSMIPDIQKICKKLEEEFEIHISESGDGIINFVRHCCEDGSECRFYAIGGDGTINHVVNGCIGFENASVGTVPLGTGNDFIKNFAIDKKDFFDFEKQITGKTVKIDLIKYNEKYCINICNIGFDANVAVDMPIFKKAPFVTDHAAYNLSIAYNLIRKLGRHMKVVADGKLLFEGNTLMCAISNGTTCGGGFRVTPLAKIDDGFIDVSVVMPPTRLLLGTFISNIGAGTQLENKTMKSYISYTKCKKVTVSCPKPVAMVNDGEGEYIRDLSFEVVPSAMNFILPV